MSSSRIAMNRRVLVSSELENGVVVTSPSRMSGASESIGGTTKMRRGDDAPGYLPWVFEASNSLSSGDARLHMSPWAKKVLLSAMRQRNHAGICDHGAWVISLALAAYVVGMVVIPLLVPNDPEAAERVYAGGTFSAQSWCAAGAYACMVYVNFCGTIAKANRGGGRGRMPFKTVAAHAAVTVVAVIGVSTNVLYALHVMPMRTAPWGVSGPNKQALLPAKIFTWTCTNCLLCFGLCGVLRFSMRLSVVLMASEWTCLFLGFLATVAPAPACYPLLGLSFLTYLPFCVLEFLLVTRLPALITPDHSFKVRLVCLTTLCLWSFFPVVFLLAAFGAISPQAEAGTTIVLDVAAKIFASTVIAYSIQEDSNDNLRKVMRLTDANHAHRTFLRFVFHEVRVPFNTLMLGTEFLMMEESMAEYHGLLSTMQQAGDTMSRTLDDVLSLAKIEEGKLQLLSRGFAPSLALGGTLEQFAPSVAAKALVLRYSYDPQLPPYLVGDDHRLSQVLSNFVSNAIKFSPEGGVIAITVICVEKSATRCILRISVQDSGIGISKEDQAQLFQPYSQIRPGDLQAGRGTGLGLAISKHVVEAQGGSIWVHSEEGSGSTFYAMIPFAIGDATDASIATAAATVLGGGAGGAGGGGDGICDCVGGGGMRNGTTGFKSCSRWSGDGGAVSQASGRHEQAGSKSSGGGGSNGSGSSGDGGSGGGNSGGSSGRNFANHLGAAHWDNKTFSASFDSQSSREEAPHAAEAASNPFALMRRLETGELPLAAGAPQWQTALDERPARSGRQSPPAGSALAGVVPSVATEARAAAAMTPPLSVSSRVSVGGGFSGTGPLEVAAARRQRSSEDTLRGKGAISTAPGGDYGGSGGDGDGDGDGQPSFCSPGTCSCGCNVQLQAGSVCCVSSSTSLISPIVQRGSWMADDAEMAVAAVGAEAGAAMAAATGAAAAAAGGALGHGVAASGSGSTAAVEKGSLLHGRADATTGTASGGVAAGAPGALRQPLLAEAALSSLRNSLAPLACATSVGDGGPPPSVISIPISWSPPSVLLPPMDFAIIALPAAAGPVAAAGAATAVTSAAVGGSPAAAVGDSTAAVGASGAHRGVGGGGGSGARSLLNLRRLEKPAGRALVVDDVSSNRVLIVLLLGKMGWDADEASNGRDGMEAVAAAAAAGRPYDAVLMDNVMPIMTGVEATAAIMRRFPGTVVIGLTGNALEEDIVEFSAAGASLVLTKPCRKDLLRKALDAAAAARNARTAAAAVTAGSSTVIMRASPVPAPNLPTAAAMVAAAAALAASPMRPASSPAARSAAAEVARSFGAGHKERSGHASGGSGSGGGGAVGALGGAAGADSEDAC